MSRHVNREAFEKVREKDHAVLECIRRGDNDVYHIGKETTLERREINHCFEKLDDIGILTVTTFPDDEYISVIDDGQPRTFRRPKEAQLTDLGRTYFEWEESDTTGLGRYDELEYTELVTKVHDHEHEIRGLSKAFKSLRRQVMRELRNRDEADEH